MPAIASDESTEKRLQTSRDGVMEMNRQGNGPSAAAAAAAAT